MCLSVCLSVLSIVMFVLVFSAAGEDAVYVLRAEWGRRRERASREEGAPRRLSQKGDRPIPRFVVE